MNETIRQYYTPCPDGATICVRRSTYLSDRSSARLKNVAT